jgi:hypothetical protein
VFSNRSKRIVTLAVAMLLLLSMLPTGLVLAQNEVTINEDINKAAGNLVINRETIVNGDVTLNLGELQVDGVVNGDVNSNMGQVTINGDINGDVVANMGQVTVSGNVSGDVRSRMGEIVISGSVGGNVDADLGATRVGGSVGGNVGSGFGELLISGAVSGNVYSKGGNVVITGIVDGDVTLEQGVVEVGPQGVVNGQIYVARGLIKKAESSIIGAVKIDEELTSSELQTSDRNPGYSFDGVDEDLVDAIVNRMDRSFDNAFNRFSFMPHVMRNRGWNLYPFPSIGPYGNVARGIINMLIIFALTALTYTLFPGQSRKAAEVVTAKSGPVIGWGLLVALLAIPLMVLLAITIIGIPLIIVEIIVLALAALLGYTGIALLVGEKVVTTASSRTVNPLGAIAIGVLILGLVAMIPFFGWLVSFAILVLALGAAFTTRFGSAKDPVTEIVIQPQESEAAKVTEVEIEKEVEVEKENGENTDA